VTKVEGNNEIAQYLEYFEVWLYCDKCSTLSLNKMRYCTSTLDDKYVTNMAPLDHDCDFGDCVIT
jgi:hypothetical protein